MLVSEDVRYNTHYTLKDLVRIAYHFGMTVSKTDVDFVYDPVSISNYIVLHHNDSIYPCIIIEPPSDTVLFKKNGFLSERYKYDPQKHKIIPN